MSSFVSVLDSNRPQLYLIKRLATTGAPTRALLELRAIPHLLEGVLHVPPPSLQRVRFLGKRGVAQPGEYRQCGKDIGGEGWRHLERGSAYTGQCLFPVLFLTLCPSIKTKQNKTYTFPLLSGVCLVLGKTVRMVRGMDRRDYVLFNYHVGTGAEKIERYHRSLFHVSPIIHESHTFGHIIC